jgi:hypothetical protein
MELDKVKIRVTREILFQKFSQEQIMEYYFGEPVKLKKGYKNPFRKDQFPTCFFFYKQNGELVFMDFTAGKPMTCIDVANARVGTFLSYSAIYHDLSGVHSHSLPTPTIQFDKEESQAETIIKVEIMPYDQKDLEFWAQFNISLAILKHFNVRRVKRAWINGELRYMNVERDRCYRYIENDKIKLYRPNNKKMKFRNNYIVEFEAMSVLPRTGDLLVISKSMKDVMTLYSLGIVAVCPKSEGNILNPETMESFFTHFKEVCIWYDADATGLQKSMAVYELYKDKGIRRLVHNPLLGKDVSDIVKNHGIEELKQLCKQLEIL